MIRYQVNQTFCNQCNKKIQSGVRRFGPAQVRCGYCGAVLNTGFDEWINLPSGRKASLTIQNILTPFAVSGCNGIFVTFMLQIFFWFLCSLPFVIIGLVIIGNSTPLTNAISNSLAYLGFLVYPGLLIFFHVRMVRESNAYSQTKVPPVWK